MTEGSSVPQRCWQIDSSRKGAEIIRITDADGKSLIRVKPGVSAVIISSASFLEVILEEGARLELLRPFLLDQTLEREVSLSVHQAKDSSLTAFMVTKGSISFKDNVSVVLAGEGAEVSLNGLHDLSNACEAHSLTLIDHVAPSTKSDQLYKSVVRDRGHSFFHGKIMVRREAQLTNAYQLNKNLILSPEGRVDTKPQLEIFADDVKCSHGAAIGQLDDDQLFYFQTRGIGREEAARMLVKGFVKDVLLKINDPLLRAEAGGML